MSDALRIRSLTVTSPDGAVVLDDVSCTLSTGASLGVVGASGSGKSTLVRAILGTLPTGWVVTGSIEVDGEQLVDAPESRLQSLRGDALGVVPQDPSASFDPVHTVRAHVREPWLARRRRPEDARAIDALEELGVARAATRWRSRPSTWSGGMLQRASIVAATALRPRLTLADEPTSALDAALADDTMRAMRGRSSTTLVVSHDLGLLSRHVDRVLVLDRGRAVEEGSSIAVFTSPTTVAARALSLAATVRPRPSLPLPAREPIVRMRGAARRYRDVDAVRDATLDLHPGEVVGIVGRSGSGKSTLLRLASGEERPTSGSVERDATTTVAAGWCMPIAQDPVASLDPRWPLWRVITQPSALRAPSSPTQRRMRARAALDRVGLDELDVERRPWSLSVGQCQRVATLRALDAGPALIVADEPTASLDVVAASMVAALLRDAADAGAAVLVVSHDEARLRSYADRTLRMRDGVLAAERTTSSSSTRCRE